MRTLGHILLLVGFLWLAYDAVVGFPGYNNASIRNAAKYAKLAWPDPSSPTTAFSPMWGLYYVKGSLGSEKFREELLAQVRESRGDHYGPELREADEAHAEKLLREELQRRAWGERELSLRRKGDPEKVEIAWRLRQETTMTLQCVAGRLQMGTWTSVSNCLVQKRKEAAVKLKCKSV